MSALLAILAAPLLPGLINRVKAWFAGRQGPPTLQLYYDLFRLMRKGAVYSRTGTWVLRVAPSLGLACCLLAALLVPGELYQSLLLLGLLALQRFALVLAALDTGSSFEGMGASREVQFGALAELGLLLCLAVTVQQPARLPVTLLLLVALFLLFLAESARVPVDDPNTHLELTMIHEVMVLDASGPDLAYILYAASLKMWVLGSWMIGLALPQVPVPLGLLGLALLVGLVESTTARLRLLRVPQMLLGASALAGLGLLLLARVP